MLSPFFPIPHTQNSVVEMKCLTSKFKKDLLRFFFFSNVYLCCRKCAGHLQPDHSAPPYSFQLELWVHPSALWTRPQETPQLPRVHPIPAGILGAFYAFVSLFHFSFLNILCDWLYLHYLHTVLRCLFLGAAVGACTPGICPKGQRQEWCHLCPGLQWHYVHYQTPRAHPFCGGEPCLGECCGSSDWYCNLSLKWD